MKLKSKKGGARFIAIYYWELELAAYKHLSNNSRALLIEFRKLYNGSNNGKIAMSVRQAASSLNVCKDTASKALTELQKKGWIVLTEKGSFNQKTNKTASLWRITNQPIGLGVDVPATKEYAQWRP